MSKDKVEMIERMIDSKTNEILDVENLISQNPNSRVLKVRVDRLRGEFLLLLREQQRLDGLPLS